VCKAVRAPANVTFVTQPSYAPELNPVERLWPNLREHHRSNHVYAVIHALEAAVAAWRAARLGPDKVRPSAGATTPALDYQKPYDRPGENEGRCGASTLRPDGSGAPAGLRRCAATAA